MSFCVKAFASHAYASIYLNSIDYILEEMYYTMYKALSNNLVSSTDLYITGSILWWTTGEQISNTKFLTFYYLLLILKQKSQVTISESRHLVIFIWCTNYFSSTSIAYLHTSSKCTFQSIALKSINVECHSVNDILPTLFKTLLGINFTHSMCNLNINIIMGYYSL